MLFQKNKKPLMKTCLPDKKIESKEVKNINLLVITIVDYFFIIKFVF